MKIRLDINTKRYNFIISLIKKAGKLLLALSQKNIEVNSKNNDAQDIVTSADIELSSFITTEIKTSFPNEIIYSEEASNVDISSGSFWSIDPIDGTSHFSRDIPHFAVVVSYIENGIPISGAVYNPRTSELFSFQRGKGAFLNDKHVKVSNIEDLANSHVFLRIGRNEEQWEWGFSASSFLLKNANKTSNFGSSALDMCFVGAGRTEASIYGTLTTIDVAAALGFVHEAGGLIVDGNGKEITTLSKNKQTVIAVNGIKLLSLLKNDIILPKEL